LIRKDGSERHYLFVSRLATAFWGLFAISLSERASRLGTLVEAVNILGSVFYGTVLGIFALAFFFKKVNGTAAFAGAVAGQFLVIYLFRYTEIVFLWYNVFGCLAVVIFALIINPFTKLIQTKRSGG
jgi:Na+/proline symporter